MPTSIEQRIAGLSLEQRARFESRLQQIARRERFNEFPGVILRKPACSPIPSSESGCLVSYILG